MQRGVPPEVEHLRRDAPQVIVGHGEVVAAIPAVGRAVVAGGCNEPVQAVIVVAEPWRPAHTAQCWRGGRTTKVAAFTILQYFNLLNHRPIEQVKYALF